MYRRRFNSILFVFQRTNSAYSLMSMISLSLLEACFSIIRGVTRHNTRICLQRIILIQKSDFEVTKVRQKAQVFFFGHCDNLIAFCAEFYLELCNYKREDSMFFSHI